MAGFRDTQPPVTGPATRRQGAAEAESRILDGRALITGGYGTGTASDDPLSTTDAWLFTP